MAAIICPTINISFRMGSGARTSKIVRNLAKSNLSFTSRSLSSASRGLKEEYEFIKAERRDGAGLITLDRPKALNALCDGLLDDLVHAARVFDRDDQVGAIVITGSKKAFAAGADIKEMSTRNYIECYTNNLFESWADVTRITKPVSSIMIAFFNPLITIPNSYFLSHISIDTYSLLLFRLSLLFPVTHWEVDVSWL